MRLYDELVRRLQNDEMAVVYASYSLRMEAIKESVVCGHHIYTKKYGGLSLDRKFKCSLSQTTAMTDKR